MHQRRRETGWYSQPNIDIHKGHWQDILPKPSEQGIVLNAFSYGTVSKNYGALQECFAEYAIQLLAKNGKLE